MKKTKLIAKLMLCVMLLSTLATTGCGFFTPSKTTENLETESINHEPQDLIDGLVDKMQSAGYDKMEFTAEYYYFESGFDYAYSLKIKIIDNHFVINGVVYDDISYNNSCSPNFEAIDLSRASKMFPEKYEVLLKIQELNSCYVLKTKEEKNSLGFGNPILVYEMDGDYYFLGCWYEEYVLRVNKATIE